MALRSRKETTLTAPGIWQQRITLTRTRNYSSIADLDPDCFQKWALSLNTSPALILNSVNSQIHLPRSSFSLMFSHLSLSSGKRSPWKRREQIVSHQSFGSSSHFDFTKSSHSKDILYAGIPTNRLSWSRNDLNSKRFFPLKYALE